MNLIDQLRNKLSRKDRMRNGFNNGLISVKEWFIAGIACIFVAAMAIGWVLNLVAIAQSDSITGMVILRIIAVFMWPIGCILGWIPS